MDREHIIAAICRTAAENGGLPSGARRFSDETGIPEKEWLGKYWPRWGDAEKVPKEKNVIEGYVYLLRAGKHYKIGRSNAVGRRERELAI